MYSYKEDYMKLYKVISQIVFLIIAYSSLSAQRDIPQVDFPRVDSSNCQCPVPPNPTVLKKGYAFISRANGLFYMENLKTYIQDSVIITGSDSVTFEEDTVCIINMGMEYCVSIDSVYILDSSFCYIVLADTTCIPWSNAGINLYISDGSLTGNRTLTQNSHWLNFGPGLLYLNSASTRVGIGTTSPSAPFKLSVAGPIYSNQGTSNTFISGGNSTLTGSGNTAVGSDVAQFMTTAFANSLYGLQSGQFITTGLRNTASGYTSLHSLTTGSDNVAIGYRSLYSAISTDNNIAIGAAAGENNTGADNVFIGYRSGRNITGSGNILLGSQSGMSLTALSNQLRIDNSDNASSLISADFNMDTVRINGSLMIRNALKDKDGDAGTSGQVLKSTVTGIDWATATDLNGLFTASNSNSSVIPSTFIAKVTNSLQFLGNSTSVLINLHGATGSSQAYHYYTNSTTGSTNTDGLKVGVDGSEQGIVINRENTPLILGTDDNQMMEFKSNNGGSVLFPSVTVATPLVVSSGIFNSAHTTLNGQDTLQRVFSIVNLATNGPDTNYLPTIISDWPNTGLGIESCTLWQTGVGQEYTISNFRTNAVVLMASIVGVDDIIDGGASISIPAGESIIVRAVRLVSNVGYWFSYN